MNLLVTLGARDRWTLPRVRLMTVGALGVGRFDRSLGQYLAVVVAASATFDLSFSKSMCQVTRATGIVSVGKDGTRGNKGHPLVIF